MSAPATDVPAAAVAPAATEPAAAVSTTAAPAATPASTSAPVPLSGTDSLTKLMIDKSLTMLGSHKAISSRGVGMLLRNLYGILFGPMFSQSWENQLSREEQKSGKIGMQKTNESSLKRIAHFLSNKKSRKSGASLALALINPSSQRESFEHRCTLIWLGSTAATARLFKIDGMKRSGILGFTTAQTTWPVICSEVSDPAALLSALQTFIPKSNPKEEWSKEKSLAWDVIVAQEPAVTGAAAGAAAAADSDASAAAASSSASAAPSSAVTPSRNVSFGSRLDLKGAQSIVCVTNDEEGLAVDLKNGLVERLKAISMQLDAMPQ